MLAADKLLLQSRIRQNAIQLKEKEFSLHNDNFGTVGTQAAVIAGFTMTAFVEISIPPEVNRVLKFFYFTAVMISLSMNVYCVSQTTTLSVCGTSLSLRGPDGSMIRAVDGMYAERAQVFRSFAIGLMSLLVSMMFGSWIIMDMEAAAGCNLILMYALWTLYDNCSRLFKRFQFDEAESTSFDDILNMSMSIPQQVSQLPHKVADMLHRGGTDRAAEAETLLPMHQQK
eukprot:m.17883 g.17883  ORF g.17883 m.17883 type:complete len:228 (+) comp11334_c0_seq2:212-895(+)